MSKYLHRVYVLCPKIVFLSASIFISCGHEQSLEDEGIRVLEDDNTSDESTTLNSDSHDGLQADPSSEDVPAIDENEGGPNDTNDDNSFDPAPNDENVTNDPQDTQSAEHDNAPNLPKVIVQLLSVNDSDGLLRCSLFDRANGFPNDVNNAIKNVSVRPEVGRCEFEDLDSGEYAVAVLHDANESGDMDTNALGIPQEEWGVSRNVRPTFRAPRFDEASFPLGEESLLIEVELK